MTSPAHLVPRWLGGCRAADCVVPLCRTHHRLFDTGRLGLVAYLGPELERELHHALTHVGCAELEAALTGALLQLTAGLADQGYVIWVKSALFGAIPTSDVVSPRFGPFASRRIAADKQRQGDRVR